jgi:hypothetical protein
MIMTRRHLLAGAGPEEQKPACMIGIAALALGTAVTANGRIKYIK